MNELQTRSPDKTLTEAGLKPQIISAFKAAEKNNPDFSLAGYRPLEMNQETARQALADIDHLFRPANPEKIKNAIVVCMNATASRPNNQDSITLKLATFVSALSKYPGDLVLNAIERWPHVSKWNPTIKELEDLMNQTGLRQRVLMREALLKAARPPLTGRKAPPNPRLLDFS